MSGYILKHSQCDRCVFGKQSFYNSVCAHCPSISYSKSSESHFMDESALEVAISKVCDTIKREFGIEEGEG